MSRSSPIKKILLSFLLLVGIGLYNFDLYKIYIAIHGSSSLNLLFVITKNPNFLIHTILFSKTPYPYRQRFVLYMANPNENIDLYNVENMVIENQGIDLDSEIDDEEDQDSEVSDCESMVVGEKNEIEFQSPGVENLVRLNQEEKHYKTISLRLLLELGNLGFDGDVVGIFRNSFTGFTRQARAHSFRAFLVALENNCGGGGGANVKYAWYGATKDEAYKIVSHGFGHFSPRDESQVSYGTGVYLTPILESLQSSVEDEDGLRYLLLCKVLLGRVEVVTPGSQQFHPSSSEFDCGVDNLACPSKYIVWGTHMNTHILPEFLVTFKAQPSPNGRVPLRKPTYPWMPFKTLISSLARDLPPDATDLIIKHYRENRVDNKISQLEFIQRVRQIAGDHLLKKAIRDFKESCLEQ